MDFGKLQECLLATLSPVTDTRKPAEVFLKSLEGSDKYGVILLHIAGTLENDLNLRTAAAITFKNFVKNYWRKQTEFNNTIPEVDRITIKTNIVNVMLSSPELIQRQMSDAIGIIGHEDFPKEWMGLLKELVDRFATGDFNEINGVLRTANSIFKRYRHEFKSQKLWEEIKFVMDNFAAPFTHLTNATMDLMSKSLGDKKVLTTLLGSITLIMKIFYSLNVQELPEHFEDNIDVYMKHFYTILTLDESLLVTDNPNEAGIMEQMKSQVCENLIMFVTRYNDDFSGHLPKFVEVIWNLLVNTGDEMKYDLLVSNAIQFLSCVADREAYKHLFSKIETLQSICEKVIVPNMQFREADEELFLDDPDEYIRKDIEGSDVDTRRRSACDLVKALSKILEGAVISNFSGYVVTLLNDYSKMGKVAWKRKDVAIFLVTTLASKAKTAKHGITQTNELVDVKEFFNLHIIPELQNSDINDIPVLKADAIKYIMVFRSQLVPSTIKDIIPILIKFLVADSRVVHSYAAATIEKLFCEQKYSLDPFVAPEEIKEHIGPLLTNLFATLSLPGSAENVYTMKAIMRTLILFKHMAVPFMPEVIKHLTEKLIIVCKNPSQPNFNHYLFETVCLAVTITCEVNSSSVTSFEGSLFPIFHQILAEDVIEFIPYVFQVLSILLRVHDESIPEVYMSLLSMLIQPNLYDRAGNIPPLIKLLQLFISRGSESIPDDKFNGILGVFQKMISSRHNDHEGFNLINTMANEISNQRVHAISKQVFFILFTRLSSSKTTKFIKGLIFYLCTYIRTQGADNLVAIIDSIQPKMFEMVINKILLLNLQKFSAEDDKKHCALAITSLLTKSKLMFTTYRKLFPSVLQALIYLFELPKDETIPDDEHFVDVDETQVEYQSAYSKLSFGIKKNQAKPLPSIDEIKVNLARELSELSKQYPGTLQAMLTTMQADAVQHLQNYMKITGVALY